MSNENEIDLGNGLTYAKSLYIMGVCNKGPTNYPILIKNVTQAHETFGINDVTKAWQEAYNTMGDEVNIYVVRVNGAPASYTIVGRKQLAYSMERFSAIELVSFHSGEEWNESSIVVTDTYLQISNPDSIGGSATFYFEDYATVGLLTNTINDAFHNGDIGFSAYTSAQFEDVYTIINNYMDEYYEAQYFNGGKDETEVAKNELHELLQMTYNILEGRTIDIFSIVGAYFDDISPLSRYNETTYGELYYVADRDYLDVPHEKDFTQQATFHGQAIAFCKKQMEQGILTHCVMAFNPPEVIEDILPVNSYSMKVADASCFSDRYDIIDNVDGNITDNGKYISVVLGELLYSDHNGMMYYNNGYLAYASYLAGNLSSNSPTNKVIPNAHNIRYNLDDDEIDYLSKLGVVTFRKSILKDAIVISNGVTAALYDTPFHIVSNVRMVQLILNAYNSVLHAYVGQDVDRLIKTKAIDKTVEMITNALLSDGVAKKIVPNLTINTNGLAVLDLEIMCNYSIEYVKATTNIKL